MSNWTLEVELENGRIRPCGSERLPSKAHGLLTVLDSSNPSTARTCGELADRWAEMEKLPLEDGIAFADDLDRARANLQSPRLSWD